MLNRLVIRNFGLIEKAELDFKPGFTVLTGETGAGKSMLVDALSLALGARGGVGFIRPGADQAVIEASFTLRDGHPVKPLLDEAGVDLEDGELVLRRHLTADGKTRCMAGGLRITQSQMKDMGDMLVDIHGQQDHQLLMRENTHQRLLDRFAGLEAQSKATADTYHAYKTKQTQLADLQAKAADRTREIDLLQTYASELKALNPQPGEEQTLADERYRLMHGEQLARSMAEAVQLLEEASPSAALAKVERQLATQASMGGEKLEGWLLRLADVATTLADLEAELDVLASDFDPNPERLAEVDERLHTLRALARKHRTTVDELPALAQTLAADLENLLNLDENLAHLEKDVAQAWQTYAAEANKLTIARAKAVPGLTCKVEEVLATLKMPDARFETRLEPLPQDKWHAAGAEHVAFYVCTNPGSDFAPLVKAASGGEMSRLMLALKVVFFASMGPQTLVFDEVDTGVGGAVADAVGQCLRTLSARHQVFAITHLPQVAARGAAHLRISKASHGQQVKTQIDSLADADRLDEIARMLAGAHITPQAREAAQSLLKG